MTTQQQASLQAFWKHYDIIEKKYNVALGDIAVFCGADINANTRSACKKAEELLRSGVFKRALVLNTSSNQRWALRIGRDASALVGDDVDEDAICIMRIAQGGLSRTINLLRQTIEHHQFDLVLINSWELSSANHRLREELIFRLHQLTSLGATVVIYSQAPLKEFTAGKILHGLGKLSALAQIITPLVLDEQATDVAATKTNDNAISEPVSDQFVSAEGHLNGEEREGLPENIREIIHKEEDELVAV